MLFTSAEFFYVFLPLTLVLHFAIARRSPTAAAVTTTLASLFFYAWWNPPFVVLPLASIGFNLVVARAIVAASRPTARALLTAGIAANLLLLGYFKYSSFLVAVVSGNAAAPSNVPLALSFTTFVQIAFLVELYRRPQRVDLHHYGLFVCFFPHLIAGPIVRWSELGPQIADSSRYRIDWSNIAAGLTMFALGMAKKTLIADELAVHVAPVFDAAATGAPVTCAAAWLGAFAYAAELYFDFSGYSDMAVGLGLLFNLRLPVNFASPFRAQSMIDLWRRWHMSLSHFLRDFVYIPLGGSRCGPARQAFNVFITMVIGGLWHGAGWTFIAWGALMGALLAANHGWRVRHGAARSRGVAALAGWAATLTAFAIGMVLFRSTDMTAATTLLSSMAGFGDATMPAQVVLEWDHWGITHGYLPDEFDRRLFGTTWSFVGTVWTVTALAAAILAPDTMELLGYAEGGNKAFQRPLPGFAAWRPSLPWLLVTFALFAAALAKSGQVSEFLYYQF